ncbi:MAG: amylo-alpha-1,6-glucosidase [Thermoleophilia bacterium]
MEASKPPKGRTPATGERRGARSQGAETEIVIGDERFEALGKESAVTAGAERFVMSERRRRRLVIKEDELFMYTDDEGLIPAADNSPLGLYFRDTRFLSRLEMTVGGRPPVLLSSTAERNYLSSAEFTNLAIKGADGEAIPQTSVHVRRTRLVSDRVYELLRIKNYHSAPVEVVVELTFDADFRDMFEVRGMRRHKRGTRLAPKTDGNVLTLAYYGLDEVLRKTIVRFEQVPARLQGGTATFRVSLAPRERKVVRFSIEVALPDAPPLREGDFTARLSDLRRDYERWFAGATDIFTDSDQVTGLLRRGQADLRMMLVDTQYGRVVAAAVPWFVAPFGRDSIVACLETLMLDARPAIDAVRLLTRLQGRTDNAFREEEPGKILHELRQGELAALKAIPHTPYYGAVDTTALYLLLVCEVVMWTGDLEFFELLREPIEAALRWIDESGDLDGDGFVEYRRRSRAGLDNQGWRDARDAVVHRDGSIAQGPIALAESQAYVYYAKRRLANLFGQLGDVELSERLQAETQALKLRFNERFWMDDEGYVALALDGEKRQVKTIGSTAGHCLWSRIVSEEHVPAVVERLMAPDMFSGWGVRTMAKSAASYSPMSLYNGSVWPFDNALIVNGLKKHGFTQEANRLTGAMFDAALEQQYSRLPEFICGFTRQAVNRPVTYPMACSPDAPAAGAPFLMLQAMLGLYASAAENVLYVHNPLLPKWLGEVTLSNLSVGRSKLSLRFRRDGNQTTFSVRDKQGGVRVVVVE